MLSHNVLGNLLKGQVLVRGPLLFHLLLDGLSHHIAWEKLVHEALALVVQYDCALPPRGLRDQKASARLCAVEAGWMNLYIVHVLELHAMLLCNSTGVPGQERKVRGVTVKPADSPCCHNRIGRIYIQVISVLISRLHPDTDAILLDNVRHGRILHHRDIFQPPHMGQQRSRDLLPCDVLVKADARL